MSKNSNRPPAQAQQHPSHAPPPHVPPHDESDDDVGTAALEKQRAREAQAHAPTAGASAPDEHEDDAHEEEPHAPPPPAPADVKTKGKRFPPAGAIAIEPIHLDAARRLLDGNIVDFDGSFYVNSEADLEKVEDLGLARRAE